MEAKDQPVEITFGDKKLRLDLDIPAMRRLRRYPEPIDIMKVLDKNDMESGGLIGQLKDDPSIAVDIAWEAIANDPDRPATAEEFAKGLAGDKLDEIIDAALEAVIRFTPNRQVRIALLAIKTKAVERQEALGQTMIDSIENGSMDAAMDQAVQEIESEAATAGSVFKAKNPKPTRKKKSKTGSSKDAPSSGSMTSSTPTVSGDTPSEV